MKTFQTTYPTQVCKKDKEYQKDCKNQKAWIKYVHAFDADNQEFQLQPLWKMEWNPKSGRGKLNRNHIQEMEQETVTHDEPTQTQEEYEPIQKKMPATKSV